METWKPVIEEQFLHLYEASDKGNIRKIIDKYVLSTHIRNGYKACCLYNPTTKLSRTKNLHRIIAKAFLTQESKRNTVNHKNGIKTDNNIENLEWTSSKENTSHAIRTGLTKPHSKKVKQYTKNGVYIKTFNSILEASRETKTSDRRISDVCKGKQDTTGGFKWKYEDETDIIIDDCEGKIIDAFPNYKITQDGKVFSIRSKIFLKPKIMKSGYKCVKLCNKGISKDVYIIKLIREYYSDNLSVPSC